MLRFFRLLKCLSYLVFFSIMDQGAGRNGDQINNITSGLRPSIHEASPEVLYSHHFGEWNEWSTCSRTCGIGISSRKRICLKNINGSKDKAQACQGNHIQHKKCKLKNCPSNEPDYRSLQCSKYNNRVVGGKLVRSWIPTHNIGANPCELRCEAEGLAYVFGKAADGTPCPLGVCVDGRCLGIGCDDRIGSNVRVDMCGNCGGQNLNCVHYKDIFQGQPVSGQKNPYHEVVILPVGARHLLLTHPSEHNVLAMQDRNKGIVLSGENLMKSNFDIAGTVVHFLKLDNKTQELSAEGPLLQELRLLVLLRSKNPGIQYEYWLPEPFSPPEHKHQKPPLSTPTPETTTTTRRPSKPLFAYPYGEKPYDAKDAPIFRTVLSTTERDTRSTSLYSTRSPYRRGLRKYLSNPAFDFYQSIMNRSLAENSLAAYNSFPTQQYSGKSQTISNAIPNFLSDDERKQTLASFNTHRPKPLYDIYKNEIPNGRLTYTFNGKSNASRPLSIQLLTLPKGSSLKKVKNEDGVHLQKTRQARGGACEPCKKSRDPLRHFCLSDFVIRGVVLGYEFLRGETRYEVEVKQSFKNTLSLLPREYVWSPDTCRCPKLRPGKEYVIMGRSDDTFSARESRLLVDKTCFVRTFRVKHAKRLNKLRKDGSKKCQKIS